MVDAIMQLQQAPAEATVVKRVALIRHGLGWHNKSWRYGGLAWIGNILTTEDVQLRPEGQVQARTLREAIDANPEHPLRVVEAVLTSPLSRTIETATLIFETLPRARFVLCPLAVERCLATCDRGTPKRALFERWPHVKSWEGADELDELWWPIGRTFAQEYHPADRAEQLLRVLASRPEMNIAVVGHHGFFHHLTKRHLKNCEVLWCTLHESAMGTLQLVPEEEQENNEQLS
mmetsp:Transcript_6249/g.15957  ORF Transcript_6249/g.15957 Transcript_6249/m.15957 type:complete len:233 (-) Transcript_6249:38-736(-)